MSKKRGVCARRIREADPPGPPRDPAPHPVTGPVVSARPSPAVPVAAALATPAPAAPSTPAPRSAMERLRDATPEPSPPRFVDMRPRYSGPERRRHQQDLGMDAFDQRQGAFKRPTPPLSSPMAPGPTPAAPQSSPMERLRMARAAAAPTPAPASAPPQSSYMERLRSIRGGPPTPRERGAHQAARQGLEAQGVRVEEPSPGTGTLGDRTAELRSVQRSLQQAQNVAPAPVLGPRGLSVRMMGQGGVDEALGGYRFQRGRPAIDVADTSSDTTFHEGGHRVDHALRGGWGPGVNPQTGARYGGFATSDPEHPLAQFAQSLRQTPEHQAAVARVQKRYGPEMAEYYSSPEEVVARFHNWHVATEGARQRGEDPPPPPEDLEEYSPETLATHGAQYRDILGRAGDIARAQPRPPFERAGPVQVATPGYKGVREATAQDAVAPTTLATPSGAALGGPLPRLRRRYYTLHAPGQGSIRLGVDSHTNEVVEGPDGYLGGNMAHIGARHSSSPGAHIEEHPPGELPPPLPTSSAPSPGPLVRNVGPREPTMAAASPPTVREVDDPAAAVADPAAPRTGPLTRVKGALGGPLEGDKQALAAMPKAPAPVAPAPVSHFPAGVSLPPAMHVGSEGLSLHPPAPVPRPSPPATDRGASRGIRRTIPGEDRPPKQMVFPAPPESTPHTTWLSPSEIALGQNVLRGAHAARTAARAADPGHPEPLTPLSDTRRGLEQSWDAAQAHNRPLGEQGQTAEEMHAGGGRDFSREFESFMEGAGMWGGGGTSSQSYPEPTDPAGWKPVYHSPESLRRYRMVRDVGGQDQSGGLARPRPLPDRPSYQLTPEEFTAAPYTLHRGGSGQAPTDDGSMWLSPDQGLAESYAAARLEDQPSYGRSAYDESLPGPTITSGLLQDTKYAGEPEINETLGSLGVDMGDITGHLPRAAARGGSSDQAVYMPFVRDHLAQRGYGAMEGNWGFGKPYYMKFPGTKFLQHGDVVRKAHVQGLDVGDENRQRYSLGPHRNFRGTRFSRAGVPTVQTPQGPQVPPGHYTTPTSPGYQGVREAGGGDPDPRPFGAENLEGGGYYRMRARHDPRDASARNVTVYVRNNRVVAGPQHIVGARWSDLQAAHGYRQGAQVEGPFDEPPPGAFEHSFWAHHPAAPPLGAQTADAGLSRALDTAQSFPQFGQERGYLEKLRSPSGATMDEAVTDVSGQSRSFTPPHLRATERADQNYHDAMTDAYYDPGGLSSYSSAQRARVDELDAARRQAHALGALHTPGGAGPYSGGNGHASVPLGDGHDGGGPPAPPPAGGQGAVRPPIRPGGPPAPSPTPGALPAPPVGQGGLSAYGSGLLASGPGAPEEPPAPAPAASAAGPSLGPLARRPRFTPSTEE